MTIEHAHDDDSETKHVLTVCECGKPVAIKKTGECTTCYQRRYHRQRYVPKSPRPKLSEAEVKERHRAAQQRWKLANPAKVQAQVDRYHARYPERVWQGIKPVPLPGERTTQKLPEEGSGW